MIDPKTAIRRNSRVAHNELGHGQGGVLLHLDSGGYHGVNGVGLLVWQLLDRETTFAELISGLRERVVEPPPTLAEEIAAFVMDLGDRSLLILRRPSDEV